MSALHGPAPKPCESCPYRRDVPSGVWSAGEYVKLRLYDEPTPFQPTSVFQCHQNDRQSERARVCAGWVATHGTELLALRIGVATGEVPREAMRYHTTVSTFATGTEAATHGLRDIEEPGPAARALMAKIAATRADVRSH